MKYITKEKFIEMMRTHKGAQPVSLVTTSKVKDIEGREYVKFSTPAGFIGFDYENSVNNAQEKQGEDRDFVAQPRKWGKHINAVLIEHNGKYYVQLKAQKTKAKPFYFREGHFYATIVQKDKPRPDHGVIVRDYSVDGIRQMKYRGETYRIVG